MSSILSQLVRFFEDDGWSFEQISDLPALRTGFTGENGKWTCYAHAREEVHQFVFYSLLPVNTPSDKLDAMAEFMTRIHTVNADFNDSIKSLYFYEWRDNLHHSKIWNVEQSPIHVAFGLCDRFGSPKFDIRKLLAEDNS